MIGSLQRRKWRYVVPQFGRRYRIPFFFSFFHKFASSDSFEAKTSWLRYGKVAILIFLWMNIWFPIKFNELHSKIFKKVHRACKSYLVVTHAKEHNYILQLPVENENFSTAGYKESQVLRYLTMNYARVCLLFYRLSSNWYYIAESPCRHRDVSVTSPLSAPVAFFQLVPNQNFA